MFMNKTLVSIPNTINQLGAPVTIGTDTPGGSLAAGDMPMAPSVDYAFRVLLDTFIDSPVATVLKDTTTEYPGQAKFSRSPNSNVYVAGFIGINQVFENDFTGEISDWDASTTVYSYNEGGAYGEIRLLQGGAAFQYFSRDLGLGDDIDNTKDMLIRTSFILPDIANVSERLVIGVRSNADANASTDTIGITFEYSSSAWNMRFYKNGAIDTNETEKLALLPNIRYTLDIMLRADRESVECRVQDYSGVRGVMRSSDGFFENSIAANSFGFWNLTGGSSGNFTLKVFGVVIWMNAVVVKVSPDNCRTWRSVPLNLLGVDNDVTECAVAIDDNATIHLVWTEKAGTPSTFYNIWYSSYNYTSAAWSSVAQVSQTTGSYNRINPTIVIDPTDQSVHIAWADESGSGTDIYYAKQPLPDIMIDDWEVIVV